MNMNSNVDPVLFNFLSQVNMQKAALSPPTQITLNQLYSTAHEAGAKLFWLGNLEKAEPLLNIAAASGNGWSQFALATCNVYRDGIWHTEHDSLVSYPSEETKKWLRLAAANDYLPALIQLGDSASVEKAKALISQLPAEEKPQGLYYQYLLTDDAEWLERSAAAGSNKAQHALANLYRRNPQMIANDAYRTARIEELYQLAADGGLPLAVYSRVFSADSSASAAEKQSRLAQLAWLGHVEGMLEYGYALANLPRRSTRNPLLYEDQQPKPRTYGLAKDLGVACAMLKFVLKNTAGAISMPMLADDVHRIETQMTPADQEQADTTLRQLTEKQISPFYRLEELIIPGTAK
ncbi:hypothetical protein [Pseudomonas cedrina]|uniref:hypothetical protein n=1 Tax=Pseudomonas cedrina TaxID=651740 RepID=UPI002788AE5D|nr:hypothetical protein [Pseudomonas cedrina]MDQ0654023.1 hypothetical protein [Pseudomonas cedrina]